MTKRDYQTIAKAIRPYYDLASNDIEKHVIIMSLITALMKQIKHDNLTFDPIKFLNYLRGKSLPTCPKCGKTLIESTIRGCEYRCMGCNKDFIELK